MQAAQLRYPDVAEIYPARDPLKTQNDGRAGGRACVRAGGRAGNDAYFDDGHRSLRTHSSHFGRRATQVFLPWTARR